MIVSITFWRCCTDGLNAALLRQDSSYSNAFIAQSDENAFQYNSIYKTLIRRWLLCTLNDIVHYFSHREQTDTGWSNGCFILLEPSSTCLNMSETSQNCVTTNQLNQKPPNSIRTGPPSENWTSKTRDHGDLRDDASWQAQRLWTTSLNPEHLNKIEMLLVCFSKD